MLLKPNDDTVLRGYAEDSAILWNVANFERRKAWFNHERIPSYVAQWRVLKGLEVFKRLGTGKSQALLQKLNEAWQSYFALLRMKKQGKLPPHITKANPPHYWKKDGKRIAKAFYVRSDCWSMNKKAISIARGVKVQYQSGKLRVGKQGRLEVLHDTLLNKWYAHFPVSLIEGTSRVAGKMASLDLGICNLAALYVESERPIVYSGRAVLSDWIYRTKKIAVKQSKLPRKKDTSKGILLQFRRRQRRLKHAVNSMCKDIFKRLENANVAVLVVGDLNGVRYENDKGTVFNQKLHNFWVFNKVTKRLLELGEEHGIIIRKVLEFKTSSTCCLCGKEHNGRVHRGLMVCSETHQCINADVNGSVNILDVAVGRFPNVRNTVKGESSSSGTLASPLLLRWNYDKWC